MTREEMKKKSEKLVKSKQRVPIMWRNKASEAIMASICDERYRKRLNEWTGQKAFVSLVPSFHFIGVFIIALQLQRNNIYVIFNELICK